MPIGSGGWRSELGEAHSSGSRQGDRRDVDGDKQWSRDELVVALVGVYAPCGREHEPIDLPVLRGVIQSGRSAQDVDGVVVTTQKPVRAKAKDLFARVTLDLLRKDHLEPTPRLACNFD